MLQSISVRVLVLMAVLGACVSGLAKQDLAGLIPTVAAGSDTSTDCSATQGTNYASAIGYRPHGAIQQLRLDGLLTGGQPLWQLPVSNPRLQRTGRTLGQTAGGSGHFSLALEYGLSNQNNGSISAITTGFGGGTGRRMEYRYDKLDRITVAAEGAVPVDPTACPSGAAWCQNYQYDAWGNRWSPTNTGLPSEPFRPEASTWYDTKNRLTGAGAQYTANGNLKSIGSGGHQYLTDAENRMTQATVGSSTTTYSYDGQGRRVKKVAGSTTTVYVYDAFGRLAAEYTTATPSQTGRRYLTADHLGSTRAIWKTDGTADAYCDYTPFGILIGSGIGGRTALWDCGAGNTVKFTGKERDAETGLDYFLARYYSGAQGRFTSPDAPFADQHTENPQSWNLYQYGYNNPLTNIDLDGRSVWTKAAKVVVKVAKTGNAAAAFADNVNDFTTVIDSKASIGSRVLAGISLLSEAAPVSLGDIKDAGRLLGVVGGVGKRLDDVGSAAKKLPDDALVVRGGMNTPESFAKGSGVSLDPNGKLQGVSVNSAPGQTVEQLSQGVPHNKVGVTTVGRVRSAGGDVTPSPTRGNPHHCTMCGVTPEQASGMMKVIRNPAKKKPEEP